MISTFGLTIIAWVFFRAQSISHALSYIKGMFSLSLPKETDFDSLELSLKTILIFIGVFLIVEWFGRNGKFGIDKLKIPKVLRWLLYILIGLTIIIFGRFSKTEFIYFAF